MELNETMEIFNEDMTKKINYKDCDLTKGEIIQKIKTIHHDEIIEQEEEGHYEVIKTYDNGGKDLKWIIDKPKIEAKKAYDEDIIYYIYIPFSLEELQKKENYVLLTKYKNELSSTDYKTLKYVEGYYTEEEYESIKQYRESLRVKIRELQDKLGQS